jgi:hypothetical protein
MRSILSRNGVSGNPGAVQSSFFRRPFYSSLRA